MLEDPNRYLVDHPVPRKRNSQEARWNIFLLCPLCVSRQTGKVTSFLSSRGKAEEGRDGKLMGGKAWNWTKDALYPRHGPGKEITRPSWPTWLMPRYGSSWQSLGILNAIIHSGEGTPLMHGAPFGRAFNVKSMEVPRRRYTAAATSFPPDKQHFECVNMSRGYLI